MSSDLAVRERSGWVEGGGEGSASKRRRRQWEGGVRVNVGGEKRGCNSSSYAFSTYLS